MKDKNNACGLSVLPRSVTDSAGRHFALRMALSALIMLLSSGCAATSDREKTLMTASGKENPRYADLLVVPEQYTTNGAAYHKKYYKCLIGIATVLSDEHKLLVVKNSIGFYYDKKENRKDRLYLGIDIAVALDASHQYSSYEGIAVALLEHYLKDMLAVVHSCTSAFQEKEILGTVIGFRWESGGRSESINIWIDKRDVARFEEMQLTLKELISRSVITNTGGKLIRLLL
jgi:hypothetical protein